MPSTIRTATPPPRSCRCSAGRSAAPTSRFLTAVMWDGRETFARPDITLDLGDQANGATLGHAQGRARGRSRRGHGRPDRRLRDRRSTPRSGYDTARLTQLAAASSATAAAAARRRAVSRRHQRRARRRSHPGAPFDPDRVTTLRRWPDPVATDGAATRDRARRRSSSTPSRSPSRGVGGLNDALGVGRSSPAPARPATTRRTSATTRSRCRSTSALADGVAPHARHAALHVAQHDDRRRPSRRPIRAAR